MQRQLNEAKDERDSIQEKIEGKAMRNHTHLDINIPTIPPLIPPLLPTLSLTTIAVGGLAAYMILRKKK